MKNNNNERGVALIAAVMITAVLAGIGISFVFNMRLEEKAAANYLWKTQADAIAQGGIERTIQIITRTDRREEQFTRMRDYGTIPPGSDGSYAIQEYPGPNDPPISLGDGTYAHTRIEIRDEAGKVNINTSGRPEVLTGNTGFARAGRDRGWTTAEIGLPLRTDIDGIDNDGDGFIDEPDEMLWERIRAIKFGGDGQPRVSGTDDNQFLPGTATINPFGANYITGAPRGLSEDGIDNDGDGDVDESYEGRDEPSEFIFLEGEKLTLALPGGDRPFITVGELGIEGEGLFRYTTLYSRDRYLNQDVWWNIVGAPGAAPGDGIDNDGNGFIDEAGEVERGPKQDINTATPEVLRKALTDSGLSPDVARQVTANIIDFRDADRIPTLFEGKRGIERTLFINEIREERWGPWVLEYNWWMWPEYLHEVDRVELKNPWNEAVTGRYRVRWTDFSGDIRVLFEEDFNVPARGFLTREPDPWSDRRSGGQISLYVDADPGTGVDWRLIEEVEISAVGEMIGTNWQAKDDPRVPHFAYVGDTNSFNARNFTIAEGQRFEPTAAGEVPFIEGDQWAGHFNHFSAPNSPGGRNFHNTGELGYIHTGEQWSTLRMRNVRGGHDGAILNRLTIDHPYNRIGRINVNTASIDVLNALPQMWIQVQAEAIRDRRAVTPFRTIGDVVPYLLAESEPDLQNDHINDLMGDLMDAANRVIHWPSTWTRPWWDLFNVIEPAGDHIHTWMLNTITPLIGPGTIPNLTIPVDTIYPYYFPVANPDGSTTWVRSPVPVYINPFQRALTTSIVGGIAHNLREVATDLRSWLFNFEILGVRVFDLPGASHLREWLVDNWIDPIIRDGTRLIWYTVGGGNLDEDGFHRAGGTFQGFHGEDDEIETIVRSISNLITTRSDRFEIVSTGSIRRGPAPTAELLAESRMRVIVCRISDPVTILHFERR